MTRVLSTVLCLLVVLAAAAPARAQDHVGLRVGVSGDPDQFVFGGHLETSPLVDGLVFRPTGEIGVGSDLVTLALNFEFAYKFDLSDSDWRPYVGGGPALNIYLPEGDRDTDIGGGLNILIGVEHSGGLFTEFKVGALDSPDIKFLVGYAF